MKVANFIIFILPFTISAFLTYKFSLNGPVTIISFFIFLGMAVSATTFTVFIRQYLIARKHKITLMDKYSEHRIAVLIPVFNENPEMVRDTALSAIVALRKRGDVYILDDSTDEEIREKIKDIEKFDVRVIRRDDRIGYKAGAMNDWLKIYSDQYDLIAIFDADQRPKNAFFDEVMQYFNDPEIAFVQTPQLYSELETEIGTASFWQQLPFLRITMRGREKSAFCLGSGTIFRTKALEDIGGFNEDTVTEDIATSIYLHSNGWKSVYSDRDLIWYGEPPKDLKAYLQQQARWSLGGFQVLPKLLKSNLKINQFIDYISGWMYWFKNGPITFFEILAPISFLLLNKPFIKIDAVIYLLAYVPFIILTLICFLIATRKFYSPKGFILHQTIELMSFLSISSSFIIWLLRKKMPFVKTPKKAQKSPLKVTLPYWIITFLLALSIIKGISGLLTIKTTQLWFATLINVVCASYLILFFSVGLYISSRS